MAALNASELLKLHADSGLVALTKFTALVKAEARRRGVEVPRAELIKATVEKSDAKKYYRSIVKQLHPDKNAHPQAKEAF